MSLHPTSSFQDGEEEAVDKKPSSKRKRQTLPNGEKALLIGFFFFIFWTTWGLGVVSVTSQAVLFGLSLLLVLLAVWPRRGEGPTDGIIAFGNRMVRSPAFWLGLLFLTYILIQILNPSQRYESWIQEDGRLAWRLLYLDYISWLPSGLDAPYALYNGWRSFLMQATAFFAAIALYGGIRHKRSLPVILWIIFGNGLALGIFAMIQKTLEWNLVYGLFEPIQGGRFYGAFSYRNFAAAYLTLSLAAGGGLFFHYRQKSLRRFQKSGPHLLIFPCLIILYAAIAFSLSRGGFLSSSAVLISILLIWIFLAIIRSGWRDRLLFLGGFALLLTIISTLVIFAPYRPELEERFSSVFSLEEVDGSRLLRQKVGEATLQGVMDAAPFGWGAGSYRHVFTFYALERPEIGRSRGGRSRIIWNQAHNDWLQYPFEFGFVGAGLALATALAWIFPVIFSRRSFSAISLIPVIGFVCLLGHSIMDFMLQNLAILAIAALLLAWAKRWVELNTESEKNQQMRMFRHS